MRQLTIRQLFLLGLLFLFQVLPVPGVVAQESTTPESLADFVTSWLEAWESQDTEAYFSHYHVDFEPDRYAGIEQWRAARITNITRPESIAINAETLDVIPNNDGTVTVRFWFEYRASDYADRTRKQLRLAPDTGLEWAILEERNLEVELLPLEIIEPVMTSMLPEADQDNQGTEDAGQTTGEQEIAEAIVPEPVITQADQPAASLPPAAELAEELEEEPVVDADEASPAQETNPVAAGNNPPAVTVAERANRSAGSIVDEQDDGEEEEWVPPGFENLNQPQITEIDIFYGGFYLTSVLSEFTLSEVTFIDKDKVVDSVPNLKDPEAFRLLLNSTFPANPDLLCFSSFQVDCGFLDTDSVGVIFDQSTLRLTLFISPDLLVSSSNDQLRFLPESEAGLSFLNQSAAFFSGQDSDIENYNLFNNTLFAWRENRLSIRSNLDSNEGFEIDTFAFMREFQGKDYRLGLMRENANGFSFMSNERFEGVAFASSLLTRTDLEQSLGTEIELFFQTRSRVEIYREGRLISTDYYNVGNNILDTSSLPNGSYTIEIRVIDASGNVTVEERYYAKTGNIAPADQALYFLHAGRLENDLDTNRLSVVGQDTFVRGGFNKRLTQSIGGNIGFSVVDETTMFETGLFKQGQNYELQANAAYEDTGASGIDLRMRLRHPKFNLTLNTRQIFNGELNSQVGLDYSQHYAMLEVPLQKGYLSLFHRQVERPLTGNNSNSGIRFRTRGRDFWDGSLFTNFELSKNSDEVIGLLTFSYQLQGNNRLTVYEPKVSYANSKSSRDSGLYGSYQSSWYTGQQTGSEYRLTVRGDYDYQNSMEAQLESDTALGSSDIVARYNGETQNMEFSGRLSTSYATNGQTSAFGGKRRSESAFLVRVEGDRASGARFEVLVNGVVRGEMAADETLMVPVSPYQTYDVELKSVGETLVDLDTRVYRETLYPGNVVNLSWSTRVISIGIGRLVNADNEPLDNAVLQNVVGIAVTDSNGFFQAEIDQDTAVLEVQRRDFTCNAPFANPRDGKTVMSLGTLVCR